MLNNSQTSNSQNKNHCLRKYYNKKRCACVTRRSVREVCMCEVEDIIRQRHFCNHKFSFRECRRLRHFLQKIAIYLQKTFQIYQQVTLQKWTPMFLMVLHSPRPLYSLYSRVTHTSWYTHTYTQIGYASDDGMITGHQPTIWTNEAVISSFESVGFPPLCLTMLRRALTMLQAGSNISIVYTAIAGMMLEKLENRLSREKLETQRQNLETQREKLKTQLCKVELTTLKETIAQGQDTCTYINIHAYTPCTIKRPSYNIMCLCVCKCVCIHYSQHEIWSS